jgi:hypothetical protein
LLYSAVLAAFAAAPSLRVEIEIPLPVDHVPRSIFDSSEPPERECHSLEVGANEPSVVQPQGTREILRVE